MPAQQQKTEAMLSVKHTDLIRSCAKEFYVFGHRANDEIHLEGKSRRTYDTCKNTLDKLLSDALEHYRLPEGKQTYPYLSIDSSRIDENPFNRLFKLKDFQINDICCCFTILDILSDGRALRTTELSGLVYEKIDAAAGKPPDEKTIRNNIAALTDAGVLIRIAEPPSENQATAGRSRIRYRYRLSNADPDPTQWRDAVDFYTMQHPLGLIGAFLQDREKIAGRRGTDCFRFQHNYMLYALDSQVVYDAVCAIREQKWVRLHMYQHDPTYRSDDQRIFPVKIYSSARNGRQYLMGMHENHRGIWSVRLDQIRALELLPETEPDAAAMALDFAEKARFIWGVSTGDDPSVIPEPETFSMTLQVEPYEPYLVGRLQRERRCGTVRDEGGGRWTFTAAVYDTRELIPWVCSFLGHITAVECSNPVVTDTIYRKFEELYSIYGEA